METICSSLSGTPYAWGKEGPRGCDCSGFVYLVAKYFGKPMPRTTARRMWFLFHGESKDWSQAGCGWIVWWQLTPKRPYGHVGVMTEPPSFWQSGTSKGVCKRRFFRGSYWDRHFKGAKKGLV